MMRSKILLIISILINVAVADARELVNSWYSVRAMGMGNAYTAVVDDADSFFYNPAGIGRASGFHWTILDVHGGLNGAEALGVAQEVQSSSDLAETLNNLYGDRVWIGGGAKSVFMIPFFGFGAYASADTSIYLSNPSYPSLEMNYLADYGFMFGFGVPLVPGFMHWGLVAKRITRVGTSMPISGSVLGNLDTDELVQQLKNRGTGYALDTGLTISVPGPVSPAFSITMRDVGYTTFSHEGGLHAPPRIEPEVVIGAALQVDTPLITITPAIDYRHATREDVQIGKKVHLGLEIDLPLIDLRAGLHQGYYTLGAGVDLGVLRVDAASYGVELGEFPGQHEDRRYVVQMTVELGFDAGLFGFSDSSGGGKGGSSGRRRLKQRR